MGVFKKVYKNINEYLYEHRKLKLVIEYIFSFIASAIAAFLFSYGFRTFMSPVGEPDELVTGGISGLSQVLVKVISLIFEGLHIDGVKDFLYVNGEMNPALYSILYMTMNFPLIILAYFKIGKKFAIFSLVNVALVSIFTSIIDPSWAITHDDLGLFERALFGGLCTGLSTALAVKFDHSAGGIDIVSVYLSSKGKGSMGRYMLLINGVIVVSFTLLNGVFEYAVIALFALVYLYTSSVVVDTFCIRQKKVQLQIITSNENMPKILITNFPHSCTVADAKGAYKETPKKIIYFNISTSEVKHALKIIQEVDESAFVSVTPIQSVYGKFYVKPLK